MNALNSVRNKALLYQRGKHVKCLMSVHLQHFPWFHSSTFLLEIQKAKPRGCLIEHRNIWGEERSTSKHAIMEVEGQSWILNANSAGVAVIFLGHTRLKSASGITTLYTVNARPELTCCSPQEKSLNLPKEEPAESWADWAHNCARTSKSHFFHPLFVHI